MFNFKKHLTDSVHKSVNLVAVLPESVGGGKRKRPLWDNGDSGSKRQATLDDLDDLESEVAEYFKNAKRLDCLDKYPKIRRLFLRYNVTIPSSAPVERLFSLGSLVLSSRRNRLTDQKFERLLLTRYSKHFTVKFI